VRSGETAQALARRYGITVADLEKWNPKEARSGFPAGVLVYLPAADERSGAMPALAGDGARLGAGGASAGALVARMRAPAGLVWPVTGVVVRGFGASDGKSHPGIDIAAPAGTPVRAAAAGRVIYSSLMKGYGNVVILDHGDGRFTVYGHNRRNLVKASAPGAPVQVEQGQPIALVGSTGNASRSQLHLEVRQGNDPVDPLPLLEPRASKGKSPGGRG
jgi:murein DD-endopeptidase MepM/ murein hydrolase activator NlpD